MCCFAVERVPLHCPSFVPSFCVLFLVSIAGNLCISALRLARAVGVLMILNAGLEATAASAAAVDAAEGAETGEEERGEAEAGRGEEAERGEGAG